MLDRLLSAFTERDGILYRDGKPAGYKKGKYMLVGLDGRKWFVHEVVAAIKYGGLKGEEEVVHHLDLNPLNNRPDNLVYWKRSFHMKWHHGLRRPPACSKPFARKRSRGRPKLSLSAKDMAERKEVAKLYRRAYYKKNRERISSYNLARYHAKKEA